MLLNKTPINKIPAILIYNFLFLNCKAVRLLQANVVNENQILRNFCQFHESAATGIFMQGNLLNILFMPTHRLINCKKGKRFTLGS